MFLPAYIIVFTILQAPTPSVIPPGVHRQAMVTESVKPVPVTVSSVQWTRDNVTEGVAQQGSQSVTVQYVPPTALSARPIPSVHPTALHVSGVYEAIVNALCALDIYCNVPAPVRPSTSRLVPVHPPSSPVQSAPPQVDSDSSSSGPAPANGRSYSALGYALGHRFFSKSTLVSSLRALGLDACQLSVFAPWCQIDSRRPSNARPGPPPNTCTLPELDRCGVGARYLEPIPLHIPYSSPTRLSDLVLVGVFMMIPVLLALGLVFPAPRAILLCPLWWFIEDLTCGVSLLFDIAYFIVHPLLLVVAALWNALRFLWGVATRLTRPAPQPPLDKGTARKYYNDIVATTAQTSAWTQIFEAPMVETTISSGKNANKSDIYNPKKADAALVAPIIFEDAPTELMAAETILTTADTETTMSLSNFPAPGPTKPEPNHTEVSVATTMENEASISTFLSFRPVVLTDKQKQDREHQSSSFDSMLTPSVLAPVERNIKTKTHSYIGASTTTSVPALADSVSSNSLQSTLAQPTSADTLSPSFVSADYNEGGVEYKYKHENSNTENDKRYEPDDEDSEDDEEEILETRYYNDEDDGFECGRCYYIGLVIAAHQEIGYNPTAYTESVPSVSVLDAALSSETSYSERIVNEDASIDNRAVLEEDLFVDTLASRSILASMSSLRGRPEHRRVHSAPTQLALFRSDFVCPTPSTAFVAVEPSVNVTIEDEAHSSNSNDSSSAAASLCEEVDEDEDQTVNQGVCAEAVAATPTIPDEAATDVLPVTDPLPEDSDNGDAENDWDSSDTIVPTTSITSADEDKDDEDKIGDSHTSEESSDDEEFMERMCSMIEAAVPTIEPAKPTLPEASPDVPSAVYTPTSTAPATGAFAIPQGTEDKVDSPVEVIVPGIIIVPPTPPASPLPVLNLPLLLTSSTPIISSKTVLFATPSTAFVAAEPSIEVAIEDQAYSSDGDIITPSAATSVCEGEKGEESTKDGEREAPADEEQTAGQDVCAATVMATPGIPDEAAADVLPVADPLPEDSDNGDAESGWDSSETIIPSASITSADEDKDNDDKLGDSHADKESSDDEEFMDCMSDMIEAAVPTAKPTVTKPTLAEAAFDVPSAASAPALSTLDTAPPVTPEYSKNEAGLSAEAIIPSIVVVPPSPPTSPLPASLPPPSTTGVAATIPPKVALTPKKKEDIFAALEAEEEEELAQQAKRAPKSAQGRWRGRF